MEIGVCLLWDGKQFSRGIMLENREGTEHDHNGRDTKALELLRDQASAVLQ